ncbi:MAG: NAD(P)H-hydrate dehydratase [Spongiibacteraceae bacterium]
MSPPITTVAVTAQLLRTMPLPAVGNTVDKNERGHVLLVAGSREIPGSALLTATSALRAGAGKVTLLTSAGVATHLALAVPEARVIALHENAKGALEIDPTTLEVLADTHFDVLVIGPGLQGENGVQILVETLLAGLNYANVILDACAINHIKRSKNKVCSFLITPNAGEVAHLKKISKEDAVDKALELAQKMAEQWDCIVAVKGPTTIIAKPDGETFRHEGGNSGLAISGSGDCLTGLIAGLVSRGSELAQASLWGVYVHARIGDLLAERYGGIGYLASEIPAEIPNIIHRELAGDRISSSPD